MYLQPWTHTTPSLRLRNEGQLKHFPCSPTTSCLFMELLVSMLPQCYYQFWSMWLHCIRNSNLEKNAMEPLDCWVLKCIAHWTFVILRRCYCLFCTSNCFSVYDHLWVRQWLISHSEPENTEGTFLTLSWTQNWYGDLWGILKHCFRIHSYESTVWITHCRGLLTCYIITLSFSIYVQNWQRLQFHNANSCISH